MLRSTELIAYYENHKDEYPVVFVNNEGYLDMINQEDGFIMAVLENDGTYDVFPSKTSPCVLRNDFIDDAKHYQLELDESNPKEILDAFVDLTYLSLHEIRQEIGNMTWINRIRR